MRFVPSPGEHLHPHRIANGNLAPQDFVYDVADSGARVTQELYPGRAIDQDHGERFDRIVSSSPSQPVPRSARASSTDMGSTASVRNAKLIASRLVAS